MEGRWSTVLRVLCAAGAVATFLPACEGPSSPAASIREPAPEPVVEVQTARLRRGVLSQALSAPGSVVARRRSLIGVEVTGRILRVHVSVGDRVAAGAPLFEIDPTTYAMALRQAEAGLDVAEGIRARGHRAHAAAA